jgi:hypothetical protein
LSSGARCAVEGARPSQHRLVLAPAGPDVTLAGRVECSGAGDRRARGDQRSEQVEDYRPLGDQPRMATTPPRRARAQRAPYPGAPTATHALLRRARGPRRRRRSSARQRDRRRGRARRPACLWARLSPVRAVRRSSTASPAKAKASIGLARPTSRRWSAASGAGASAGIAVSSFDAVGIAWLRTEFAAHSNHHV